MDTGAKEFKFFTLMELLTVTAVIGVLLSLLLPVFAGVRESARSVSCKSNLYNLGLAAQMYSVEYKYVMPASFGETNDGFLNHFINYIISTNAFPGQAFQCPSMSKASMFDPDGHDPTVGNLYRQASYIMNIVGEGQWSGASISGKSTAHGWGYDSLTPIRALTVLSPSSKIHIMDVAPNIANTHSGVNRFSRTDHGEYKETPTGNARWVGMFHKEGFNAVYGDGHVEWQTKTEDIDWAVNR